MNRNLIKKDGFSNLDTQRFYESWTEEWQERNAEQEKHCGFCLHCHFLLEDPMFCLCLNADSPYCYETVEVLFTCPVHEPYPEENGSGDELGGSAPPDPPAADPQHAAQSHAPSDNKRALPPQA